MAKAYIGIGCNLGDRQANIDRALALLKEDPDLKILGCSHFIETEPVDSASDAPKFLNGALAVETDLLPLELLSRLKGVERRLGRVKSAEANAPRPMDLDILFYNDVVIVKGKNLTIPHPRIAERRFVLEPLLEIAPDLEHPRLGKTVRQLHEELICHDHRPEPRID